MAKKKKARNFRFKKLACVLALFISGFCIYKTVQEVIITVQLKQDIAQAKEIIADLEKQNAEFEKEKVNLEDEEYVKRYARGKYMVIQEEEQLFTLPQDE